MDIDLKHVSTGKNINELEKEKMFPSVYYITQSKYYLK